MTEATLALLSAILGAALGFASKYVVDAVRRRHELRTRWDAGLFQIAADFAREARELLNAADARHREGSSPARDRELATSHDRMRTLSEQLRLLGTDEVQRTSRTVIHHAYSVRGVAEGKGDRYSALYRGSPRDRYLEGLDEFYRAVRTQLRVDNPEAVERYDPQAGDEERR